MTTLVCYESGAGGESIATRELIKEIRKSVDSNIISIETPALTRYNSVHFYLWTIQSIIYWVSVIYRYKKINWIYTTTYTAGIGAILLKLFKKYQIVWHFHGDRVPPSGKGKKGKSYFTQFLKHYSVLGLHKIFIKYLDLIFVPSEESRKTLLSQFDVARKKNIFVIPNGVDLQRFSPASKLERNRLKIRFKIPIDHKVLLYVGRIEKMKGIEDLVNVLSVLNTKMKNHILLLAHTVPQNEVEVEYIHFIKSTIDKMKLTNSVHWIQNHSNLVLIYNVSDLVVSLSRMEHFPLTMLEAWATKTLYISRGVGAISDYLSSIDSRLIIKSTKEVEIAESISSVLSLSLQETRTLQNKGYSRTCNYTWKRSADMIISQMKFESKKQ